jgi:hypothetical protein
VQLEAVALEPLHLEWPALDQFFVLVGCWEAEHRQAAVLLPILANPAADTLAGLRETALVLRLDGGREHGEQDQHERCG